MSVELKMWLIFVLMFMACFILWCVWIIWRQHGRIKFLEAELEIALWLSHQAKPLDPADYWKYCDDD